MNEPDSKELEPEHRFLDEAGDTTFYGKGKRLILGESGVSATFSIGMLRVSENLCDLRNRIVHLQSQVAEDAYLNAIPSVARKIKGGGFYFHATDDPPEVRQVMFKFLKEIDCSIEVVVARKIPRLYATKHNGKESEFYADVLSHLIKTKMKMNRRLVLNIAQRANCTKNHNLLAALQKAKARAAKKWELGDMNCDVVFNVQNQQSEPILNIADYLCWPVQRVVERGEMRYYDYIREKIRLVVDLYDTDGYAGNRNYYTPKRNPLTPKNKISPHIA